MIQVPMSDKHAIQTLESQARLQDLALGAFSTIDQKAELVMDNHLARKPTVDGWSRSGGAKEDNFEQGCLKMYDKQGQIVRIVPYFVDKCPSGVKETICAIIPKMTEIARTQNRRQSDIEGTRYYAKTSRHGSYQRGYTKRGRPPGSTSTNKSRRKSRKTTGGVLGSLSAFFRGAPPPKPRGRPPGITHPTPTAMSLERKLD